MSNSRIIFILGLIIVIGGAFILFPKATHHGETETEKISVVTTLFPLYSIAQEIGGPYADVTLLLPPGVSPHNYEPTPSDILTIAKADVFIYTGPFMEPWAADILAGMDTSHMTILNASTHAAMAHHEEEDADEAHEEDDHDHEAGDPHIWLSPHNARAMAEDIGDAIAQALPQHTSEITSARDTYISTLDTVFEAYKTRLATCETRTLVYGGHYAFGYIAEAFDLEYIAAQGYSPDAEPSAQDLATLSDIITRENATAIFTGELESSAIADLLARETGAQVLLLNPAGNIGKDARDAGVTFIDILESNLATLREGLRCE
jgi:zinc transport system substrate-binding protein